MTAGHDALRFMWYRLRRAGLSPHHLWRRHGVKHFSRSGLSSRQPGRTEGRHAAPRETREGGATTLLRMAGGAERGLFFCTPTTARSTTPAHTSRVPAGARTVSSIAVYYDVRRRTLAWAATHLPRCRLHTYRADSDSGIPLTRALSLPARRNNATASGRQQLRGMRGPASHLNERKKNAGHCAMTRFCYCYITSLVQHIAGASITQQQLSAITPSGLLRSAVAYARRARRRRVVNKAHRATVAFTSYLPKQQALCAPARRKARKRRAESYQLTVREGDGRCGRPCRRREDHMNSMLRCCCNEEAAGAKPHARIKRQ